jgi:hypothetical protein
MAANSGLVPVLPVGPAAGKTKMRGYSNAAFVVSMLLVGMMMLIVVTMLVMSMVLKGRTMCRGTMICVGTH